MALAFSRSALAQPIRAYGALLLHGYEDPHAELLTLLWCRRFDRELARTLLEGHPDCGGQLRHSVQRAADHFDLLSAEQQQRLRRLILRHRRGWDNQDLCKTAPASLRRFAVLLERSSAACLAGTTLRKS